MIAKKLQRALSQPSERPPVLPWWMGPQTLERVHEIHAEIEGQLSILAPQNHAFQDALARLGFAGRERQS